MAYQASQTSLKGGKKIRFSPAEPWRDLPQCEEGDEQRQAIGEGTEFDMPFAAPPGILPPGGKESGAKGGFVAYIGHYLTPVQFA
jgi:hypothetical protein